MNEICILNKAYTESQWANFCFSYYIILNNYINIPHNVHQINNFWILYKFILTLSYPLAISNKNILIFII